jgi:hypothetical protein
LAHAIQEQALRRSELLIAGGATAAVLGVIAATAIPAGDKGHRTVADSIPPVEVRTEVVRRTINVYRREHPHRVGATPGASPRGTATRSLSAATSTRTSGRPASSTGAPAAGFASPVRARASGVGSSPQSRPARGESHGTAPRTRTSGSAGAAPAAGSSKPARTRTSGGHGEDGGHDD